MPEPTEPSELTDLQLTILSVLWERREATVAEIHDEIGERAGASRKTIATLLDRLERRGYVKHKARDRENVYRAWNLTVALFSPVRTVREIGASNSVAVS